jgi:hypothetical protein
MNKVYLFFFIKQLIQIIIFLSELDPLLKIISILVSDNIRSSVLKSINLDLIEEKNKLKNGKRDRVNVLDELGSLFSYFQIIVILIENEMITKTQLSFLLILVILHSISSVEYLYNHENKSLKQNPIFPDIFKVMVFILLIVNYYHFGRFKSIIEK